MKNFKIQSGNGVPPYFIDGPIDQNFNQKYLKLENCTTKNFLKSIAYNVQLNELLKIRKTCAYNERMVFTPIVVDIVEPKLKTHYGGNFLLQVYDKSGERCYEKVLQYDIPAWNIFFDYFIFKLDKRESGSEWIYVVHLQKDFAVIKVKDICAEDPTFIYFGVNKELLYYANQKEFKIIDIQMPITNGETIEFIPKTDQYITYPIKGPCRLLKIFETSYSHDNYLMCSIETDDNQIDTTRLYQWTRDLALAEIEFFQYREVVRRENVRNDPIVKFKQTIILQTKDGKEDEWAYAVALRQSGMVDLYWNYTLTSSPEEEFMDVELTYKNFYLKRKMRVKNKHGVEEEVVKQLVISLENEQRIGPDVAEIASYKTEKWNVHFYDLIRYYVRIFTRITLVTTNFFVAYNKVVSIYDIVKKEWKFHFFFEHDVIEVLRNQKSSTTTDVNVAAYLENGDLKIIDTNDIHGENWSLKDQIFNIEGKLETMVSDWRDISSHYILTRLDNGRLQFTGFQCSKLIDLNPIVKFTGKLFKLNPYIEDDELIRFISPNLREDFVLLNRKKKNIRTFVNKEVDSHMNITEERQFKLSDPNLITGKLHSMVASHNKDSMLLFDDKNLYILSFEDGSIQVQHGLNVQSLQVLDVDYCYSLSNESKTQKSPGFYIQNVNAFIDKSVQKTNFKLKGAIVGINDLLDFYQEDQRIAYMANYDTIKIVPVLHRCAVGFIGMKPREKYLAFKKIKDRLIALDKKGYLTTWSIITGKILSHLHIQKGFELGSYRIYQHCDDDISYKASWCQPRVLLIDRDNPVEVDQNDYYGDRLKTALENNTPYIKIEQKTFLKHRMIEILNSSEIEEHFTFVHPNYGYGEYQRIYFSDDLQFMIERLQNQRVFFYKRRETVIPGEVKWDLIRRIKQFPMDLSECTYVNYLFSPNLQLYLDYDKDDNIFLIKNTIDQSTFKVIPQGLMNPSSEPVHAIGKKFRWLDNQRIRIMNVEGFEKTIDITTGFKEISYSATPNFDNKYLIDNADSHYYYDISVSEENQTIERLRRKYQEYYSAIYSDLKTTTEELYEVLFRVDYNIEKCKGKLVADMSFTFFHWKLAEMMQTQAKFDIKNYHPDELKALALNIFPGGNTVLHYAYKQLKLVRRFYKVIEIEYKKALQKAKDPDLVKKFEIPFIQNYEGKTPIHLCLENQNYKSADIILTKLCNEEIDSHTRSIVDILPEIVQAELPSVGPYLDSRVRKTKQLKEFRRGAIRFISGKDYALGTVELWTDSEEIKQKFFTESKIDSEVVLRILDVPAVHSYQEKVGDEFFDALANCKNIDIFTHKSVQALIDYKWPVAKEYTIKILFIPYVIFLMLFIVYSNVFNVQYTFSEHPGMYEADIAISACLYLFSIYFLQNEIRQIIMGPIEYFKSIWNYCDIVPPCFMIAIVSMHLKRNMLPEIASEAAVGEVIEGNLTDVDSFAPSQDSAEDNRSNIFDYAGLASIHSIAILLMWFKVLYFLRIFESTGYLVRMITEVVSEMKIFLLMLGLVLVAFGEAFLRLSESSTEESQFIINYAAAFVYAFRLAVGDTVTDTFNDTIQPALVWIIFCLCLLLTNVVMLNLLIAIISEAFNDINNNAIQANYQERARIISENCYLIPKWRKKQIGGKNKYLVIAKEKTEKDDDQEDPQHEIIHKIKDLHTEIAKMKKEQAKNNTEVLELLHEIKKEMHLKQEPAKK